jgi:hypothetical protein
MSAAGLIFLFVAALLMVFAIVLQFVMPSLLLMCVLSVYKHDRTIPKAMPRLYRWAMYGWLLGLTLIIIINSSQVEILFSATFLGAFIFAVTHLDALELRAKLGVWRSIPILHALLLAVIAMLVMLATSMPLLVALHAVERYAPEGVWSGKALALLVCNGTAIVSLVPGYMYLNARTWRTGIFRPLKLGLLGAFLLSYIVLACAAFFVPISSAVLQLANVYSNELQTFQIIQPNLVGVFSEAGLSVHQDEKMVYVSAYVRYGFGGTRLLCRAQFRPETISDDAIKVARKNKLPDPGVVAGSGCVPTSAGEVRPFKV